MKIDVVLLPRDLKPEHLKDRAVAVFDVLRATTTMTAALAAGVEEIRLFGDLASAKSAADTCTTPRLLCGESACLPPEGFDLGNSPGQFTADHRGAILYMCTTNGTRALLAAREAPLVLTASTVNAAAIARVLKQSGREVTLLCAGTQGQIAMEDVLGAGVVIDALAGLGEVTLLSDIARIAHRFFMTGRNELPKLFRDAEGGRNVIAAGLEADIDFAARVSVLNAVGVAAGDPLTVRRFPEF